MVVVQKYEIRPTSCKTINCVDLAFEEPLQTLHSTCCSSFSHRHNPRQLLWVYSFHCIGVNCHVSSLSKVEPWQKSESTLVHQIYKISISNKIVFSNKIFPAALLALGGKKRRMSKGVKRKNVKDWQATKVSKTLPMTSAATLQSQATAISSSSLVELVDFGFHNVLLVGTKGHSTTFQSHRTSQQHRKIKFHWTQHSFTWFLGLSNAVHVFYLWRRVTQPNLLKQLLPRSVLQLLPIS